MKIWREIAKWSVFTSCFTMTLATPLSAEDVKLRMKGGGFEISGELKAYNGTTYAILSNELGNLTIDANRFDCITPNCPTGPYTAPQSSSISAATISGETRIAGSNTIGNALMPAIIDAFAKRNGLKTQRVVGQNPLDLKIGLLDTSERPIATIDLARHGSSTSFRELEAHSAEIGMSSRRIKTEEVTKLGAAGLGDMLSPSNEHVIGLDGLVVIVSSNNPLVSVPQDKLAGIFAGTITDWAELGREPGKINVYAPTEDSGTYETFKLLVLDPGKLKLSPETKRTENHKEQSDWVAADKDGIGFVGIAYQRNAKALNIELTCGMIARPSVFSMKTEEYPLTRRLYLYTDGHPRSPLARAILDFALSNEAQPVVRGVDFIDQSPEGLAIDDQQARVAFALSSQNPDFSLPIMRRFLSDTKAAHRLSTTLRFQLNSTALDSKAQGDIRRLAAELKSDRNKGKQVMLLGFADALGSGPANESLSLARAQSVNSALRAVGYSGAIVAGYGEMSPVACNDTPESRNMNRRVEVWIR